MKLNYMILSLIDWIALLGNGCSRFSYYVCIVAVPINESPHINPYLDEEKKKTTKGKGWKELREGIIVYTRIHK